MHEVDSSYDTQNIQTDGYGQEVSDAVSIAEYLAASLISDAYFKPGGIPGGYQYSDMSVVHFAQISVISPADSVRANGLAPDAADENETEVWRGKIRGILAPFESLNIRKTAFVLYPVFVVPEQCTRGERGTALFELLKEAQKTLEKQGLIADIVWFPADSGSFQTVSGRKIANKKLRKALEKTAKTTGTQTGEMRSAAAQNAVKRTGNIYRSLESKTEKRGPNLLIFLIVANVLIFAAGWISSQKYGFDPLVQWGVQDNQLIFQGEVWRLFTSMFLHANLMHLMGNMIFLYMLGRSLYRYYSNLELWLIYFLGGLAGNLLGLAFSDARSLGASGAIMGLGGALIYRMTLGKNAAAFRHTGNFTWLGLTVAYNLVYGLFTEGIDNYGHFGGFFGGFLTALVIAKLAEHKKRTDGDGADGGGAREDAASGS